MKPMFYHLAKHGPWEHHVRTNGSNNFNEICEWLLESGYKFTKDWFYINYDMGCKTEKVLGKMVMNPIFFFNDPQLASYVKLTWGSAK